MTRNSFLYCLCHPYCLSYFGFWLWTLFAQPRRGRGEIRTFSSLCSGARAAHNGSSWGPFSEESLRTTHSGICWGTRFREKTSLWHWQPHFTEGSGTGEVQRALSATGETRADCAEPLPAPGGPCMKEGLGPARGTSLQRSSWGSVPSPPASQNLQTNGTVYPSFHL